MNKWVRFLPSILWMAVIFYMSGRTGDEMGVLLPFFQQWFPAMNDFNWGHFIAYFILACTLYFGFGTYGSFRTKAIVVVICVLYGISDEYHQSFVAGRHSDWLDLRNDTIGAALAMVLVSIPAVNRFLQRRL
jgi:VanZ family protein